MSTPTKEIKEKESDSASPYLEIDGTQVLVNVGDLEQLAEHEWRINSQGYPFTYLDGRPQQMARFLMQPQENQVVIYLNHDRTDCRRENLRVVGYRHLGKHANRYRTFSGVSKYRGVTYDARHDRWVARIYPNRRCVSLRLHDDERDAAYTYDLAAVWFYGPDAYLNFPEQREDTIATVHAAQELEELLPPDGRTLRYK